MKGIWKVLQRKVDDRAKRVLAAWLGVCIVLELVMSGIAPMGIFADDGSLPVHEITVTEKAIREALENKEPFWDEEDVNLKIPYKQEERRMAAQEKLEELLLGMTIVTQKSGKDWSAIVAAYSNEDTSEEDFSVDQVLLIGLNGNQNKNCIFRLRITNAEGITIRTMTVTGYSMDGPSGYPGTPSEATPSEATPSSVIPTKLEVSKATESVIKEEDALELTSEHTATPSDLSSKAEEGGEAEPRYGYEEDYTLYLRDSEIANVVEYRKARTLLQASSPQEENKLVEMNRTNSTPPMMIAKAGAIVAANAESTSDGSEGNIAEVEVKSTKALIEAGIPTTFFELSSKYSVIDDTLPETAYAMVQFTAKNPDGSPYRWLGEPDSKAVSTEALKDPEFQGEWEEIKKLLAQDIPTDDWKMIAITATDHYFYSAAAGMAVMPVKGGGSSASGVPIRLSFKNGVTKDGTTVTATPGLLNLPQIIAAYKASTPNPGTDEEIRGKFIFSEPAVVESTADFYWNDVKKSAEPANLGDLLTGAELKNGRVEYRISTQPNYKSSPEQNVHYTKAYTLSDTMEFEGFYLDVTGYRAQIEGSGEQEGNIKLKDGEGKTEFELLNLSVVRENNFDELKKNYQEGAFNKAITTKLVYENGDETTGKVTGIQFDYTLVNHTLDGEDPVNLMLHSGSKGGEVTVSLNLKELIQRGILKYRSNSGEVPKIKNSVDFEAYSNQYKGDDFTPGNTGKETDKSTVHYSHSEIEIKAKDKYPLTKTAYHYDNNILVEAKDENKVFTPDSEIYYKLTVTNGGYSTDSFKIQDSLPKGIVPGSVSLEEVKIGSEPPLSKDSERWPTTEPIEDSAVAWTMTIPAGEKVELLFKTKIEDVKGLTEDGIGRELKNEAFWYRASDPKSILAKDEATVYVNMNQLTSATLNFEKLLKDSEGEGPLLLGDTVVFDLKASLAEEITTEQWLTITDEWPGDKIALEKVSGIRPGAIVILRDENKEEIARFENTLNYTQHPLLPYHFYKGSNTSNKMKSQDIPNIRYVEVSTYVPSNKKGLPEAQQGVTVTLKGKLTAGGEIKNKASTSVEGTEGEATLYSLGMSIEKKAYYISKETAKKGIKEENSRKYPVTPYLTFAAGDVVCYEVEMKNAGENLAIAPVLTDDISKLFGEEIKIPELVDATIGQNNSSAFYSVGTGTKNRVWTPVSSEYENGTFTIDVGKIHKDGINMGESLILRFYVRVPEAAIKQETAVYENRATASLSLGGQKYQISASVDISTVPEGEQAVSIHKEVFAVGNTFDRPGKIDQPNAKAYLEGAQWNTSEIGAGAGYSPDTLMLSVYKGKYIIYKITVRNEGKTPLQIYEVEDWLPVGVEYDSFYEFGTGAGIRKAVNGSARLYLGTNQLAPYRDWQKWNSKLYYEDSDGGVSQEPGAFIRFTSKNDYRVDGRTYRAKLYGVKEEDDGSFVIDTENAPTVRPGESLVFGIIAKVISDYDEDKEKLINTAGVLVRKSVNKADAGNRERETTVLSGMVGQTSYDPSLYKIVTDTAAVKTDIYTPGIEKVLKQYFVSSQWNDYNADGTSADIVPTDPMRWQITLYNGKGGTSTRGPIREYTIQDTLPLGFEYDAETYTDGSSNYMKKGNAKQPLPSPKISGDGENTPYVLTWRVTYQDKKYYIQGAGSPQLMNRGDWSIPAKGTVTVMIGTKGNTKTVRYGTYVNRSDLIPGEQYPYQKQCAGELDYDAEHKIRSVYAVAQVDIFGSGRTEAWKEIYYGGSDNIGEALASGRDSQNNYVLAAASTEKKPSIITYKLNVGNRSKGFIENLVVIDHLPEPGDTGLINNSARRSDFKVTFAKDPKVRVYIESGTEKTELNEGFTVSYGDWDSLAGKQAGLAVGSALPEKHWKSDDESYSWASEPEGMNCIRIAFNGEDGKKNLEKLTEQANLVVEFDAALPKGEELVDIEEAIAWNTFGYAYNKVGESKLFTVEPAKVGVKVPRAELHINKMVESPIENDLSQREYHFTLMMSGDGKNWNAVKEAIYRSEGKSYKTGENGEFTLKNKQSAHFIVPANYYYRVTETYAEDFLIRVTPFGDSYSDVFEDYQQEKPPQVLTRQSGSYHCTFKNIKTSLVLPETGGHGTAIFHKAGLGMIALSLLLLAFMGTGLYKKREEEETGGQVWE